MRSLSLAEIQSDACNQTLVAFFAVGTLASFLSIGRAFQTGWEWQMTAHLLQYSAMLFVMLRRHHLSLNIRAGFLSLLLFTIGVTSVVRFGVGSGAVIFFVAGCIFAGCFFSLRATFVVMGLGCLCLITVYTLRANGIIPQSINPRVFANDMSTWLLACLALIVASSGPIFALSAISRGLEAERKRADDAANARSQFLARMSHELRAPMTTVIGMGDLLQSTQLTPEQTTMTSRLLKAARNLLSLLNDVLDFSKVDAGRIIIETAPFSLAKVIGETTEMYASAAAERSLSLITRLPTTYKDNMLGDSFRLAQVLSNLISNAVKFTEHGTVSVDVTQIPRDDGLIFTTFSISDTGIGITPSALALLFQPFVQADSSTTRKYGGSGLGLVISQSLVQAMGGEITVASTPNKGATFTFTLPLQPVQTKADDAKPVVTTAVAPTPSSSRSTSLLSIPPHLRILLADDDPMVHTLIKAVLEDAQAQITSVKNGAEAVSAVTANPAFDLILIDMHMPEMDGIAATRHIRSMERAAQTPIIALTADIISNGKKDVLAAGAIAVVSKPIMWAQLQTEINRALKT